MSNAVTVPGDKLAELQRKAAMADEYQEWIDFYHRGDGDYTDFLRKRFPPDAAGVPPTEGAKHG